MKKVLSLVLAAMLVFALAACGADDSGEAETPETITITALDANGEEIDVEVPVSYTHLLHITCGILQALTANTATREELFIPRCCSDIAEDITARDLRL